MTSHPALSGTWTALVTPFTADASSIDFESFDKLLDAQLSGGVSGLVPCGTTGESPTLTDDEQASVIRHVLSRARGKLPVFAGTGSFSTAKTIHATQGAEKLGVDGAMVVMPYYNKPSQDGLVAHVLAVAAATKLPLILYNIPGRSVVDLSVESVLRICDKASNVIAIKDASGNVLWCQELMSRAEGRVVVLCGDDALTVPMMSVGAAGVISVSSNVLPKAVSTVTQRMLAEDCRAAATQHRALFAFHKAMFLEPNPAPAKAALHHLGLLKHASVRLPLLPASEKAAAQVKAALAPFGARP